jgi:hypothetical protein
MGAYTIMKHLMSFFPSENQEERAHLNLVKLLNQTIAIVNIHLKCTTLWILGWSKFEVFCAPMCILDERVNPSTP